MNMGPDDWFVLASPHTGERKQTVAVVQFPSQNFSVASPYTHIQSEHVAVGGTGKNWPVTPVTKLPTCHVFKKNSQTYLEQPSNNVP